jgi:hypothetical protein
MSIQTDNTVEAMQGGNTGIGMSGWSTASTRNMILAVEVTNVQFVLSQVILPDVISVAVISNAAGSDISIMTSSIHSFSTRNPGTPLRLSLFLSP